MLFGACGRRFLLCAMCRSHRVADALERGDSDAERGSYCLGVNFETWPGSAGCGPTCRLAVLLIAGCGLRSPKIWGRWLPVRLPGTSLAT